LLASVLYSPIITNLGTSVPRLAIALAAFALVMVWKAPPWVVVACAALAGVAASLAGAAL
jgi:chromate transporter